MLPARPLPSGPAGPVRLWGCEGHTRVRVGQRCRAARRGPARLAVTLRLVVAHLGGERRQAGPLGPRARTGATCTAVTGLASGLLPGGGAGFRGGLSSGCTHPPPGGGPGWAVLGVHPPPPHGLSRAAPALFVSSSGWRNVPQSQTRHWEPSTLATRQREQPSRGVHCLGLGPHGAPGTSPGAGLCPLSTWACPEPSLQVPFTPRAHVPRGRCTGRNSSWICTRGGPGRAPSSTPGRWACPQVASAPPHAPSAAKLPTLRQAPAHRCQELAPPAPRGQRTGPTCSGPRTAGLLRAGLRPPPGLLRPSPLPSLSS